MENGGGRPLISLATIAACISLLVAAVAVIGWSSNVNSQISELRASVDTQINEIRGKVDETLSVTEQRRQAISAIKNETSESISLIKDKHIDVEKLSKELERDRALNVERLLTLEENLETRIDNSYQAFLTKMDSELSAFEAQAVEIVQKKSDDIARRVKEDVGGMGDAQRSVEAMQNNVASMINDFKNSQVRLEDDVTDFEAQLGSYVSETERRLSEITGLPEGMIILVSGKGECPIGFRKFARTMFYVAENDRNLVSDGDFVQDSTYDVGVQRLGSSELKVFVSNGSPGHARAYDARVAMACISK